MLVFGSIRSEAEEFVVGSINNLNRYIIAIKIPKKVYDDCVNDNATYTKLEDGRFWSLIGHPLLQVIPSQMPSNLEEKAPPGKKAKRFIKKAKADFKERYGDAWEEVLYATAHKIFGKKKD